MYHDPFITALNTQKAGWAWFDTIAENLTNLYTPGYREKRVAFSDFVNGVRSQGYIRYDDQGDSMPGRSPTNMMVEGKGYFVVRATDDTLRFTRLGDFEFNGEGTLVNERGWKLQGYLLGENGEIINTGESNPSPSTNNPNHGQGGPGQVPTTEINLWVDPSNGKFFGKYDEYRIQSDGVVVGLANGGRSITPLYKIALANFTNQGGLHEVEEHMFVPTALSGQPMAGTGEVRSGLLEQSNTETREDVVYLQQAKLQLDVAAKLISTNKNLLEESLRLIQ